MRVWLTLLVCLGMGCASGHQNNQPSSASGQQQPFSTPVAGPAPDFTATAVMPDNSFQKIRLSNYRGQYVILFFYPGDFTYICPTEVIAFNEKLNQFTERNCQILGASVDSHQTHLKWKKTPPDQGGIGDLQYPLIANLDKKITRSYGVLLHDGSVALRGWFLIDTKGKIRHALVNDLPIGRNTKEALRTLDAVRFVDTHPNVCPADWQPGMETLAPTLEGVADYLSKPKQK